MNLKILSYNWHEPYLCLLSEIGHTFLIVEPELAEDNYRRWDKNMRSVPNNVILVSESEAMAQLDEGSVDLVIAHNVKDLVKLYAYSLPKILVFHNKLSTEIGLGNNKINRDDYLAKISPLLVDVKKVFISESKRCDWGMDGDVILPGIDVDEYGGYTGENRSILRVGNLLKERDLMMGFFTGEAILSNLPSLTLGMNPNIQGSRMSSGFDDLLTHYRVLRVYLHTTTDKYEDGYNLSLLEAMAVGMPVISTANKTSPIINGVNGYISENLEYLSECTKKLLDDPYLAKALGTKARETVREKFSKAEFLRLWRESIQSAIVQFLERSTKTISKEPKILSDNPGKNSIPQYFKNIRNDIVSIIPDDAIDILEIGCASGMTGSELKKKAGIFVAGVELNSRAAAEARKVLDDVIEGNIEFLDLPYKDKSFDCILFADVLEHLVDPLAVLKKTRKFLRSDGTVIASLPNVQYLGLIHHLIEGNWTYQDEGILDRTHLRFFTYREMEKLFNDAGYEIMKVDETLDPQYEKAKNSMSTLNIGRLSVRDLSPEELKKFFVFQYKISAKLKNVTIEEECFPEIKENYMSDVLKVGKSLEDASKYDEAVRLYSEMDSKHDDYAEVLARLGNCHMRLQDISNAENSYRRSLELEPQGYVAGVGLGLLEIQLNKLDDSINRFISIAKNNPDSDKAFSGLGIAYRKKQKIPNAMDAFSRALIINIENNAAMSNLLELSYQENRFDQIELAMNRYLEIYPANTNILLGLAGIQYKTKRMDGARNTLSSLLAINPNHEDANKMLDQIDSQKEEVY